VEPRRLGPLESSAGQGEVSIGSRVRGQGGGTSRQGVEASGLDTPKVKMDKKGGFQATSQLPVGRGPDHEGSVHGV